LTHIHITITTRPQPDFHRVGTRRIASCQARGSPWTTGQQRRSVCTQHVMYRSLEEQVVYGPYGYDWICMDYANMSNNMHHGLQQQSNPCLGFSYILLELFSSLQPTKTQTLKKKKTTIILLNNKNSNNNN